MEGQQLGQQLLCLPTQPSWSDCIGVCKWVGEFNQQSLAEQFQWVGLPRFLLLVIGELQRLLRKALLTPALQ